MHLRENFGDMSGTNTHKFCVSKPILYVCLSMVSILSGLLICTLNHASTQRDQAMAKLKKARRYCCKGEGKGKNKKQEEKIEGGGRASGVEGVWEGDYTEVLSMYE
ncbi:hypothetical protein HBI70_123970 [Parastagonospora nodorum]|nr:hypothetical protein HBI70_123970 [Parastagonospora nodorum]KAH5605535.1 hypothetical protein HBI45_106860 [Parastagonospora nodorum]KAH6380069.1 hypothetical protein HBI34_016310 [Parastagonospora nodorum]